MNKYNIDEIPSTIFDWMRDGAFKTLSTVEKETVLKFLSAEEYDEMHEVLASLKITNQNKIALNQIGRKEILLHKFDQVFNSDPIKPLQLKSTTLFWQAAAVIFFFTSTALFIMLERSSNIKTHVQVITDTLYQTLQVPSIVHDTIRIYDNAQSNNIMLPADHHRHKKKSNAEWIMKEQVNVLSIKDINEIQNQQRGNSMKDDSLIRKHSFISL